MSIWADSPLDTVFFTVAPPFQAVSFAGRDDQGRFVDPVYYPVGELSSPPPGRELTYLDSQGRTADEVSRRVRVVPLRAVVEGIRTNDRVRRVCAVLRHPDATKEEKSHLKMTLLPRLYPAVFDLNAENRYKFTDRNVARHQGIVVFDVDNVRPMLIAAVAEEIRRDVHTLVSFLSPRGNGYKWMVRVPSSVEDHGRYYDALLDYYRALFVGAVTLDVSCRNINRTVFASHDPDVYVNETARVWSEKKTPAPAARPSARPFDSSLDEKLATALRRVEEGRRSSGPAAPLRWVDGQRHYFLVSLAGMMKGMGVSEQEFRHVASAYIPDRAADKTVADIFRRN